MSEQRSEATDAAEMMRRLAVAWEATVRALGLVRVEVRR